MPWIWHLLVGNYFSWFACRVCPSVWSYPSGYDWSTVGLFFCRASSAVWTLLCTCSSSVGMSSISSPLSFANAYFPVLLRGTSLSLSSLLFYTRALSLEPSSSPPSTKGMPSWSLMPCMTLHLFTRFGVLVRSSPICFLPWHFSWWPASGYSDWWIWRSRCVDQGTGCLVSHASHHGPNQERCEVPS